VTVIKVNTPKIYQSR